MDLGDAVRGTAGGVALAVEVVPGARGARFPAGFNPWRGAIEARVEAPPERGRANAELAALVAAYFGVAPSAASVVSGRASRRKVVEVAGVTASEARERLGRDVKP